MISGSSPRLESLPEACARLAKKCGGLPVKDEDSEFVLQLKDGDNLDLKFYFGKRQSAIAARSSIESSVVVPPGWQATIDSANAPIRPSVLSSSDTFAVTHRTGTGLKWFDDSMGRALAGKSVPPETPSGQPGSNGQSNEPAVEDKPAAASESKPTDRAKAGRPPPQPIGKIPDSRLEIIGALSGMLARNGFRNVQDPERPNSRVFRPSRMEEATHDVEIRAYPDSPRVLLIVNSASNNQVVIDQLQRILNQKKHYESTPVKIVRALPDQQVFALERRNLG